MIDRPKGGERAVLVHIHFPLEGMQEELQEFVELVRSAGAENVALVQGARPAADPRLFVGAGKAQEIADIVKQHQADLVLFNHALSPAQERNLENILKCRVLDRTGLILDIFAQRARSFEGKLQVELALLKHMSTRLVRGWTHLERQRGGIGLRGPGETQLETDRRLIRRRIQVITKRLVKVREQREQSRRSRQRADVPTVALVGYTNAGKSTLFQSLTGAEVYIANRLFATLDPTLRRLELPEIGPVIFADTVGFIRHLPHDLIEAFHATLAEVAEADLLLHVIDASDDQHLANKEQVNAVLESIDAAAVPQVLVYNKVDLCLHLNAGIYGEQRVRISAKTGVGLDALKQMIVNLLNKDSMECVLVLGPEDAKLRAELYRLKAVRSEEINAEGEISLLVRMKRAELARLKKKG